ncbi:hypothetical protein P8610_13735 [Fictibacillus sp. UD]|uniref:hypothetical protein n=1 Tax=Fictibacillus sp. UD TaxID=3038777 RepID=UPI0037452247
MTVDHKEMIIQTIRLYFIRTLCHLGNGYFGLYSGDVHSDEDNRMKIYYYDEVENKLVLKREENLDTVEIGE